MEKYIKRINEIIREYNNKNFEKLGGLLEEIKKDMIYETALKNVDKKGKLQLQCAKKILKDKNNDVRPLFQKVYKIDDEYMICNGYIGICLKNMINGLELHSEEDSKKCLNIRNIFPDVYYNFSKTEINMLDLEKSIIENKNKRKDEELKPFIISKEKIKIAVNPEYLKNTINVLGGECEIICSDINSRDPIYLKSELGEGIVLPIVMPKEV